MKCLYAKKNRLPRKNFTFQFAHDESQIYVICHVQNHHIKYPVDSEETLKSIYSMFYHSAAEVSWNKELYKPQRVDAYIAENFKGVLNRYQEYVKNKEFTPLVSGRVTSVTPARNPDFLSLLEQLERGILRPFEPEPLPNNTITAASKMNSEKFKINESDPLVGEFITKFGR